MRVVQEKWFLTALDNMNLLLWRKNIFYLFFGLFLIYLKCNRITGKLHFFLYLLYANLTMYDLSLGFWGLVILELLSDNIISSFQ